MCSFGGKRLTITIFVSISGSVVYTAEVTDEDTVGDISFDFNGTHHIIYIYKIVLIF